MQVLSFRIVAATLLLGAAACADHPVAPDAPPQSGVPIHVAVSARVDAPGRTGRFLCRTSIRTPEGPYRYRYGQLELDFPRAALAPDGGTVLYRYQVLRLGEEPTRFASCVIPNTEQAIRLTHAYFRVGKHAQVTERRRGSDGESTTQGCVREGMCELQAIEVTVEGCSNPDWTRGEDGVCRSDRGSTGSGGSGGTGTGWGDGGGGGGGGDGYDPSGCDQAVDPTCEKPLTSTDSAAIAAALSAKVRKASDIQDPEAARQCQQMLDQFNALYAAGNVFRGAYDTRHYGATTSGHIHFDPKWLDAAAAGDGEAQRQLANTALHEAAHALGFNHPAGATWSGGQDYYTDQPFNLLSPGPNSCIVY